MALTKYLQWWRNRSEQRQWGSWVLICEAERLVKRYQWENAVYSTQPKPADDINKVWGAVLQLCLEKMVEYFCKDVKRHYLLKLLTTDSMFWLSTPYLIKYSLVLPGISMQGAHKSWPGLCYIKLGKILISLKSVVKLFQTSVFFICVTPKSQSKLEFSLLLHFTSPLMLAWGVISPFCSQHPIKLAYGERVKMEWKL